MAPVMAPPSSLLLAGRSSDPWLVERPRSSALPRLAGLGSSRPSMVPQLLMLTPLPRPPSEPEALGLAGAAPLTPLARL
jgi:hypothetical protein